MATRIYTDDFESKVLESDVPVVVDFYSDSCITCKKLAPTLCDIEEEYEGKLNVFKVNTNYDTKLVEEYEIKANPTLILFKEGKAVGKQIGPREYDELVEWLEDYI
ncbi:thioredoxin 1 [Pseudobutyrivibrio ruminis]|uniref:Thioredoxin n=2 Tax=Pseudobutyrivibrio ruminis TaxID=46206 RepID=A0A1H7K2Z4_9FIRM|nr:thioredoxin domain-containing protein [Pseudobutyrivibrio ruminis]MBO6130191.1 thiol reductase thioredoxin [Pseudobutyrivibrio sp.]SEK81199.1 thioredoxin 1 [Pseudobutyrivibrio ruminis]SOC05913.1 thioredoxin [Pseudobutyrivibrio ruminis DSM 9787]